MEERTIEVIGVLVGIFFIVTMIWIFSIMYSMNVDTNNLLKTIGRPETERLVRDESTVAKNITRSLGYNHTTNLTYANLTHIGFEGNSTYLYEFNETACDESVKHLGVNCTCFVCGQWIGYETKGFYNQTGTYYSDGTPTYMTYRQLAEYEEMQSNIRYRAFMHERGIWV